jgi:hypothetical protein
MWPEWNGSGLYTAIMAALLLPSTTSAQCPCNTSANYALLMDFYTNSTGWINSSGWGDPLVPICEWYGISCSGANISYIALKNNCISGTLPPSWSSMTQLLQLYLYSNSLTGPLPPSWSSMTQHLCYGVCRL